MASLVPLQQIESNEVFVACLACVDLLGPICLVISDLLSRHRGKQPYDSVDVGLSALGV
jgi:hypothetical protein